MEFFFCISVIDVYVESIELQWIQVIVEHHVSLHHPQHRSIPICQRWTRTMVCQHICTRKAAIVPQQMNSPLKKFHRCIFHRTHTMDIRRRPLIYTRICTIITVHVATKIQSLAVSYQRWTWRMCTMSTVMDMNRINSMVNIRLTSITKRNSMWRRRLESIQAATYAYKMVICITITVDLSRI